MAVHWASVEIHPTTALLGIHIVHFIVPLSDNSASHHCNYFPVTPVGIDIWRRKVARTLDTSSAPQYDCPTEVCIDTMGMAIVGNRCDPPFSPHSRQFETIDMP
jgi:hypothetical protein